MQIIQKAKKLAPLFLVLVFFGSFTGRNVEYFNYGVVLASIFILFRYAEHVIFPRSLKWIAVFILFIPLLQYLITGNYAGKLILNFFGFLVIMIALITMIYKMDSTSLEKFHIYLERLIIVTIGIYVLTPIIEFGLFDIFTIDRNYLYASANRILPDGLLGKQKMSMLVVLFVIMIWRMRKRPGTLLKGIVLIILLILGINMLLGSRSQTVGLIVALLLYKTGNSPKQIAILSSLVALSFLGSLYILTLDFVSLVSHFDVRVMLFHSAAITFFDNIFSGVGLYYISQFLDLNGEYMHLNYSYLYPKLSDKFPTGYESSFIQLAVELGLILYLSST